VPAINASSNEVRKWMRSTFVRSQGADLLLLIKKREIAKPLNIYWEGRPQKGSSNNAGRRASYSVAEFLEYAATQPRVKWKCIYAKLL